MAARNGRGRYYLTGDIGVVGDSGALTYLGRGDDQVKINGVRLELGEVEHVVRGLAGVRHCVAVARAAKAGVSLAVYAVADASRGEINSAVKRALPRQVVLDHIVFIEEIPLSPSGKIARDQLPEPAPSDRMVTRGQHLPKTPFEIQLAEIWCGVLEMDQVFVDDWFQDLGGDSLSAVRVASRAQKAGINLSVADLFGAGTIAALAPQVAGKTALNPTVRRRGSGLDASKKSVIADALRRAT